MEQDEVWPDERAEALLDLLEDRLDVDDLEQLREYNDVGEEGEFTDLLAAVLLKDQTPLSANEFAEVKALLYWFPAPTPEERLPFVADRDNVVKSLNVVSSSG